MILYRAIFAYSYYLAIKHNCVFPKYIHRINIYIYTTGYNDYSATARQYWQFS
jgi:hypothetical protein